MTGTEHEVAQVAAEHRIGRAERRPVQELEHAEPATRGAQSEQQRQAERRRQGEAAQQSRHVHGGGSGVELDDEGVRDDAALRESQIRVEKGERDAADHQAEQPSGHETSREHPPVAEGAEPRPFRGEPDQSGQDQHEDGQEDQHDEAAATGLAGLGTECAGRGGHGR